MINKYFFSIGGIEFVISSSVSINFPPSYRKFITNNSSSSYLFCVNVYMESNVKVAQGKLLIKQRTYEWVKCERGMYYIFTGRNRDLKDDGNPWILEIESNICNLFIPEAVLKQEFFDRPWLHRLFSYFLPDDYVLSHGGCVKIGNSGCLILGECGKGKSTFIDLMANIGYETLCDDRVMLHFAENELFAYSTPWNMKNPQYITNKKCRVKGACFLEHAHSEENKLIELDVSKGVKTMVSQLYLPIPKKPLFYLVLYNKRLLKTTLMMWEYHFMPEKGAIHEFANKFEKYVSDKKTY